MIEVQRKSWKLDVTWHESLTEGFSCKSGWYSHNQGLIISSELERPQQPTPVGGSTIALLLASSHCMYRTRCTGDNNNSDTRETAQTKQREKTK